MSFFCRERFSGSKLAHCLGPVSFYSHDQLLNYDEFRQAFDLFMTDDGSPSDFQVKKTRRRTSHASVLTHPPLAHH